MCLCNPMGIAQDVSLHMHSTWVAFWGLKCLLGMHALAQDKILQSMGRGQEVMVTNDGATILKSLYVDNPAAKVLVGARHSPYCVDLHSRHLAMCQPSCMSLSIVIFKQSSVTFSLVWTKIDRHLCATSHA